MKAKYAERWDVNQPIVFVDGLGRTVRTQPAAERFWSKVDADGDCWIWTGCKDSKGYGSFTYQVRPKTKRTCGSHTFAYEALVGPVGEGLELDHLCRVRACVNPDHLQPVTHFVNVMRGGIGAKATKKHCKRGHELTPENTEIRPSKAGRTQRVCKTCRQTIWSKTSVANRKARSAAA